jgi:hypothetical protein
MKKLTTNKKLKLHAQTLKNLTQNQLVNAAGGRISWEWCYLSDQSVIIIGTIGTLCPND